VKAEGRTEWAAGRRGGVERELPDGREDWGEYNSDEAKAEAEAAGPPIEMGGRSTSGTSFPHHDGFTLTSAAGLKNPPKLIPANLGPA